MTEKYYVNQFGGVHGNDTITPVGRAAFVYLSKPNTKFDPPKYGLTILFDKKDAKAIEQLKSIQAMCAEMCDQYLKTAYAKEKTKPAFDAYRKKYLENTAEQPIFRDGDKVNYQGFAGHWYIVAKNDKRTGFVLLDEVLPESIEPGMLVRAQVQPYCDKQGFSYKLRGLKFVKDDGVRFAMGPDGASMLRGLDDAAAAVQANESLGSAFDSAVATAAAPEAEKQEAVTETQVAGLNVL